MFCFGIVIALLGTIFGLPEVRSRLALDAVRQGTLLALLYVGLLISTPLVGPVIDGAGNKTVLVFSSALVALALIGFMFAHSYAAAMAASFLLGLGGGGLNVSTNALTSDLYVDERGAMLNLLGMFFGVGALFVPLLTAGISRYFTDAQIIGFAVGLQLACLFLYLALRFPAPHEGHGFSMREVLRVARYPGVLLFAALLFFESGNEAVIGGWISTYAGSIGMSPQTATWVLSGYWAGLMAGRLAAIRLLLLMRKTRLIFACVLASFLAYALLLSGGSVALIAAGVFLTGLFYSTVYPTTLAIVGDCYPRFTGSVFSLLFTLAMFGGIGAPWAVGRIAQSASLRGAMLVPVAASVCMCLILLRVPTSPVAAGQPEPCAE